ncbi:MAG TPA: hypothetical protein VJ349_02405 [Stellaceae bacterium]|nr:hypothetical protein [Stellaceae bacterium]
MITSAIPKVPSGWRRQKIHALRKTERRISGTSSAMAGMARVAGAAIVMAVHP